MVSLLDRKNWESILYKDHEAENMCYVWEHEMFLAEEPTMSKRERWEEEKPIDKENSP